jgi:Protein of unknown function (DUF1091)
MKSINIFYIILLSKFIATGCQRNYQASDANLKYLVKFKGIKCENFDNTSVAFIACYVKPVSRTVGTLNLEFDVLKSLDQGLHVQLIYYYRYGTIFREIMKTKPIDWCQAMKAANINPLFKFIHAMLGDKLKRLLHPCPFFGNFKFYNVTIDQKATKEISIFPEGMYKLDVKIFMKEFMFVNVMARAEVSSPLKKSFG